MNELRDPLDDLLAEIPAYVVPDARAAWAAGARRRTRQRVGVGAAAVVVVALLAGAVTWLPRTVEPQPADGGSVGGYPARVLKPWIARDLPEEAGPMAMVYRRNGGGVFGWWVANAGGRTWPVPQQDLIDDYPPALSPDGRMLGYLATQDTYILRDLVTGVENGLSIDQSEDAPWHLAAQNPAFWSPDSKHLLLRVGGSADAVLLDQEINTQRELKSPGFPAGWVDDDTLAFVVDGTSYRGRPPAVLRLVGTDGKLERTVTLDIPRHVAAWVNQWGASVSPDGARLAIADGSQTGDVYELSTADGSRQHVSRLIADDSCSPSWQGSEPVVTRTGALVTGSADVLTDFDSRLDPGCAMATPDALAGEQHVGLAQRWFGDGWLAYNLSLAAMVVAGAAILTGVALLLLRIRRRRVHHLG